MFGVGIHFSIRDLLAVRGIAIPGAIGQIVVATALGTALGMALGWGLGGGLVLGLALSVASTVVLIRALEERRELDTNQGRIAVGWLIVEDLFTVVVLVLIPAVAPILAGTTGGSDPLGVVGDLALALGNALLFAVVIAVIGVRIVPRVLVSVARDGSRELFTLGVLAVALGIAFLSSEVFGVSLALGAFVAGVVVGESDVSHQAAADAVPLRDAFAVLFFASVGMLVDPGFLLAHPVEITAVVLLIVGAKALAAFGIVVVLGHPVRTALTIAAALAQIGEFSFILATLGMALGLLPSDGFQLIVAGAVISITLNPVLFGSIESLDRRLRDQRWVRAIIERQAGALRQLPGGVEADWRGGHTIIAGYGRVARIVAPALDRRGFRYIVISTDRRTVERLRARGKHAIYGDATNRELLLEAGVRQARMVVAAVNDGHAARLIVDRARELNPRVRIVARSPSDEDAASLRALGPDVEAVFGERELAIQMLRYALRRYGISVNEVELIAQGLRRRGHQARPDPRPPLVNGEVLRGLRLRVGRVRRWVGRRGRPVLGSAS
jgi:CPA2 family monovalent cation:H+ antiporter-2